MRNYLLTWRTAVLVSFALCAGCIVVGMNFWMSQTDQWRQYMYGRLAYTATMYDTAVDYFDVSYNDYQQMLVAPVDAFTAPPSLEMAELSQHFKALALVKEGTQGSIKAGVLTFKEALKLTVDDALTSAHLSSSMDQKIRRDRFFTAQDLEILFHNQPKQAEKEGKGRGQGDKDGDKKSDDPNQGGNQAGKDKRDVL
jgi:hypothetical protein